MDLIAGAKEIGRMLAVGAADRDARRILPHAEMEILKASGLCAARVGREYGGRDASFVELGEIITELSAGDPNVAQAIQPHFFFVEALRLDGTSNQQAKLSAEMLRGALFANAFAERGTKIVGQTATTLKRGKGHLLLNGRKFYCTGSLFADYLYATAVNEHGVMCTVFFERERAGVEIIDDWDGMGQRTTVSGTTVLDDVKIAEEEIIPQPTLGSRRIYVGAAAQLVHAAIDVGIAKAALADSIAYAPKARPVPESGVERASDDPHVIHSVGEMAVAVHTAEAMLARAGRFVDAAAEAQLRRTCTVDALDRILSEASIAVAEAKAIANSVSLQVCEMMYRVGGAGMTSRKYNFDRHWRNARTHTLHDPVSYKYRAIGDFHLNGRLPPLTTKL